MKSPTPFRILGLDPGSFIAGYGCLQSNRPNPALPRDFSIVGAGALKADRSLSHANRIGHLHEALDALIDELKPSVCIMESAFHGVNVRSAIKLGEARGALIAAARRSRLELVEITPAEVKKTVTGQGNASKEQVHLAMQLLLNFRQDNLPFDVTDALAMALCYGLSMSVRCAIPPAKIDAPTVDRRK